MIEEIRKKIAQSQFEFTQHATDQSILRRISVREGGMRLRMAKS